MQDQKTTLLSNSFFRSAAFLPALFFFLLLSGGCSTGGKLYPCDRWCVINAVTGQPESDVLIAFRDKRSGKMLYGKTNSRGLAELEIPRNGWNSAEEFEFQLGKPGFDPPVWCSNPPSELRRHYQDCTFWCIVPKGTDRKEIKGHDHRREDVFSGSGQTQEELRAEWEAYLQGNIF